MSFLKINDPLKRDAIVKEYLDLRNRIRSNLLSERIGESQLQTDLSKFYRPITETQKTTTREITEGLKPITEGLKPIKEGIEKIPEAIQTIVEEEEEEEEYEEDEELVGDMAYYHLSKPNRDEDFGISKRGKDHYIGKEHAIIKDNNIFLPKLGENFIGTDGLWELLTSKNPQNFTDEDEDMYEDLMIMTNALHRDNDENNPHPKGNHKSHKWVNIIRPIWYRNKSRIIFPPKKKEGYEGKGVVVIPSDPNALLERLDLLLASKEAGHTGVRNELVSICDELKRQCVLDTNSYKKLNHIIKK